jgi:hypothetical protein
MEPKMSENVLTNANTEGEFKQEYGVYPDVRLCVQFTYRTQRRSSSDHVSDVFRIEVAVGDVVLNHKILAHGAD